MTRQNRKYQAAALLLFLAAALHAPILFLDGQARQPAMIAAIIFWLMLGFGLLRGLRPVAYLGFLTGLAGAIAALYLAMSAAGLVSAVYALILAVNAAAAVVLFGLLWTRAE
ncbi:hypothetical protein [Pseudorhodobacter sp.]|uniref:hypothetical protein n=1 Tax=Pseudorhodobacter sp. TaxID=1934400 RepID=UPI0026477C61|nr:hypothetical protein [Pseudorhodobacter sp.]MDN5787848.1 hypothetical protein [Pseudorhodobacter sp.]